MYAEGEGGVRQDYVLAYMWFNLAAAQGEKDASDLRDNPGAMVSRRRSISSKASLTTRW
jgi:TPR repeat protein